MSVVPSLKLELRTLLRLSAPVALTQLGLMTTGIVDTLMVSHLGVKELAASALGNTWQWAWLSMGLGVLMGLDPLISQAHGRGDQTATALALQRGVVLALLVSVPICACLAFTREGLLLLGQEPEVAALAARYNLWKIPTVPCFLVYSAIRQYLQGRTLMAAATWVMWIGNALHVPLNWLLIFGHLGAPALGLVGAGLASSLMTAFLVVGLVLWVRVFGLHHGAWRAWDRQSFAPRGLLQMLRLGVPVGAQISLEVCAFSLATMMAGWLGTEAVASHQIVLNMAALSFMVPLGVSQAAAARVGNLIGEGDVLGMRRAVRAALLLGAGVMVFSALLFSVLRFQLPRLFTEDAAVVLFSAQILPIAAAFQLSDGTQVVSGGVLRGMGRPNAAAAVNLVGYYALALPLAYVLGFRQGLGLVGVWIALALGLTTVALALLIWVRRTARRPLEELVVVVDSGRSH
ncbi:MAG TPA: MATE family efflux transporter [Polyangiaceae bacterium]|nr:MATE family efflux transporter [Polyangiaceae bacterium]